LTCINPAADEGGQSSYKLVVGTQIMSELKLRDDILDELEYEPIVDAAHIGVAVDRDVVTLTGHVGSYAQKLAAISAVRRVKGVHGIADEIEVRYASDAKASDDEITSRALNVLSWDSVVPGNAIQVTVRDGLVTLTGKVNWYYQKRSAERDVQGLSGVRSVVNNIEIEPHAKPDNVKKKIEAALRRQAGIEAKDIRVTVRDDDEVLPEGKVRNWDEKFAVENAAWSAPGVKNVKDKLTIGS
jgi:osmotically-inducible protein OsmY